MWMTCFQTEECDQVRLVQKKEKDELAGLTTDQNKGYKAAASQVDADAEPIYLQKVAKLPSPDLKIDKKEFFGQNCYRISNARHYSNKDIKKQVEIENKLKERQRAGSKRGPAKDDFSEDKLHEPIKRYLGLQPFHYYSNEETKIEEKIINFFPNEAYGSLWQFENLKCPDFSKNYFTITHKKWLWMRSERLFGDELGEYEDNFYVAIRKIGNTDEATEFCRKNDHSSYMYLTKDRNKAAVFTWKECPARIDVRRMECPLSMLSQHISSSHWQHLPRGRELSLQNFNQL